MKLFPISIFQIREIRLARFPLNRSGTDGDKDFSRQWHLAQASRADRKWDVQRGIYSGVGSSGKLETGYVDLDYSHGKMGFNRLGCRLKIAGVIMSPDRL